MIRSLFSDVYVNFLYYWTATPHVCFLEKYTYYNKNTMLHAVSSALVTFLQFYVLWFFKYNYRTAIPNICFLDRTEWKFRVTHPSRIKVSHVILAKPMFRICFIGSAVKRQPPNNDGHIFVCDSTFCNQYTKVPSVSGTCSINKYWPP